MDGKHTEMITPRSAEIHVSHCQGEGTGFLWRAPESAQTGFLRIRNSQLVPLGWWFLLFAEPDIHSLYRAPKSRRRRLSLCSLPVPKQSERASGVASIAQSATCGTWQPRTESCCLFFHSGCYATAALLHS